MKIAVLGSGMVGRALASRLVGLGHEVVIGTRDEEITLARTEPDAMGQAPYAEWQHANPAVRLVRFSDAAAHGELVINATAGASSLAALDQAGAANLAGKIIVELANALSFSQGRPPLLSVANTDSLGEQIQRAYSDARVVKALNTVAAAVMIDPGRVPGHQASSSSPVRTTTPRTRSSACWASSAGRRRRSSTSVASAPPEPPRCTWRSASVAAHASWRRRDLSRVCPATTRPPPSPTATVIVVVALVARSRKSDASAWSLVLFQAASGRHRLRSDGLRTCSP